MQGLSTSNRTPAAVGWIARRSDSMQIKRVRLGTPGRRFHCPSGIILAPPRTDLSLSMMVRWKLLIVCHHPTSDTNLYVVSLIPRFAGSCLPRVRDTGGRAVCLKVGDA
jgi:hypothetical protein